VDVITINPNSMIVEETPFAVPAEKPSAERPTKAPAEATPEAHAERPAKILVVDIGGSKIKVLATGQTEPRKAASGKTMTPAKMVETIKELAADWEYEAVSIGYPGLVGGHGPRSEPGNLGSGWVGFNFAVAFGCPVRVTNDAAMQALGSYDGGRMLFLGLGTGVGSALISENVMIPLELGQLMFRDEQRVGDVLGKKGLERLGKEEWMAAVQEVVKALRVAFIADYVVLGGGNAKKLQGAVPGTRLGHNLTAFRGGERLWTIDHVATLSAEGTPTIQAPKPADWRVV
jgi:polyphosphate glucokinase